MLHFPDFCFVLLLLKGQPALLHWQCVTSVVGVLEILSSQVHFHFGANSSRGQVCNLTLSLDLWRRHCFSRCTVHVSSGLSVRRWWPYSSWCLSNSRQMAETSLTTLRWRLKSQGQTKSFQSGSQWDVLCHWALVSKQLRTRWSWQIIYRFHLPHSMAYW